MHVRCIVCDLHPNITILITPAQKYNVDPTTYEFYNRIRKTTP